jgi:hypothetical protein
MKCTEKGIVTRHAPAFLCLYLIISRAAGANGPSFLALSDASQHVPMETVAHVQQALNERYPSPLYGEFVVISTKTTRAGTVERSARARSCIVQSVGARGGVYVTYPQEDGTATKSHSVRIGQYQHLDGEGRVVHCLGLFRPLVPDVGSTVPDAAPHAAAVATATVAAVATAAPPPSATPLGK